MKEHGILFSAGMVRAILAGTKVQDRRTAKPLWLVGDLLWVRETWRTDEVWDGHPNRNIPKGESVMYLADESATGIVAFGWGRYRLGMFMPRWASRITLEVTGVRAERLQDISEANAVAEGIERLSPSSRLFSTYPDCRCGDPCECANPDWTLSPLDSYRALWGSINGKTPAKSWAANPLVSVTEFRVVAL